MAGFLCSLNLRLPRSVQVLQLGGLANAFGNGIVLPFTFIYLHNVRGIGLGNTVFIFAGLAGFGLLSVYAKNEAGVDERALGIVFLVNTLVFVIAQLPIAKLAEGRRRMRMLALLGVVWAGSWLLVPLAGVWLTGTSAAALFAFAMAVSRRTALAVTA